MNRAVVALGSNIEPEKHIEATLKEIEGAFRVLRKSAFVYTRPLGISDQPDFLNGVVLVETALKKQGVIKPLKNIEQHLGRNKDGHKDGPRKIDLDLVVYNGKVVDEDVFERSFLQRSIQEVLPEIEL